MKKRNNILIPLGAAMLLCGAALAVQSCGIEPTTYSNSMERQYLEAWLSVNYPGVSAFDKGIYILEEEKGNGNAYNQEPYPLISLTTCDLEGTIASTTDENIAKRLGTYRISTYYGPTFWDNSDNKLLAGVRSALQGMKVGGRRKVLIPSWLLVYDEYDTAEDYFEKSSSQNSYGIYDITLEGFVSSSSDMITYQENSISDYARESYGATPVQKDTAGFFIIKPSTAALGRTFPSDTTLSVNYTGRLLNGIVFDTTIEKVAKDSGIYSSSKSYSPVSITWGEKYSKLQMGTSQSAATPVVGFQLLLWQLTDYDSITGLFISDLGYGNSGTGSSIPAFAPLVFEIEMVK